MSHRSKWIAAVATAFALIPSATASAGIWTPVASNTTETINAIEAQSAARQWFATAGGKLFTLGAGGFTQAASFPGVSFNDIAFQSGAGAVGLAVGSAGTIERSINGGISWAPIAAPVVRSDCFSATTVPIAGATFFGISWGDANTVYVVGVGPAPGNTPIMLKSINGGASFVQANDIGVTGCKTAPSDPLTDVFTLPGTPTFVYGVGASFGSIYFSADGWTGVSKRGEMINNFDSIPRIAVDPANTNRLWAVDHSATSCGSLCFQFSDTGAAGATGGSAPMNVVNATTTAENLWGVGFAGGTVVAAGDGGEIFTSVDGHNAFLQPADGTLATTGWRAVGVFDATHAIVGGVGGALASTAAANNVPDTTPPTGTVTGPTTATTGVPITLTANVADEPGGSGVDPATFSWTTPGFAPQTGPTATYTFTAAGTYSVTVTVHDRAGNVATATATIFVNQAAVPPPPSATRPISTTTGGATITIYRLVTVTGRTGRFIPVRLAPKGARTFTVRLYRSKGKKAISSKKFKFTKKGVRLVHLPLPATAGPGKYKVKVEVFKKGHRTGRIVSQAIVVA